jgi:hypothetical protein
MGIFLRYALRTGRKQEGSSSIRSIAGGWGNSRSETACGTVCTVDGLRQVDAYALHLPRCQGPVRNNLIVCPTSYFQYAAFLG